MAGALPKVGFVSLGCPKALVDSEHILTRLRAEGYLISPTYADADLVVVNTCGFIDSAVDESLEAIGEAVAENGRVIVTGFLGARARTTSGPARWRIDVCSQSLARAISCSLFMPSLRKTMRGGQKPVKELCRQLKPMNRVNQVHAGWWNRANSEVSITITPPKANRARSMDMNASERYKGVWVRKKERILTHSNKCLQDRVTL